MEAGPNGPPATGIKKTPAAFSTRQESSALSGGSGGPHPLCRRRLRDDAFDCQSRRLRAGRPLREAAVPGRLAAARRFADRREEKGKTKVPRATSRRAPDRDGPELASLGGAPVRRRKLSRSPNGAAKLTTACSAASRARTGPAGGLARMTALPADGPAGMRGTAPADGPAAMAATAPAGGPAAMPGTAPAAGAAVGSRRVSKVHDRWTSWSPEKMGLRPGPAIGTDRAFGYPR